MKKTKEQIENKERNWIKYLIYSFIIVLIGSIIAFNLGWKGIW